MPSLHPPRLDEQAVFGQDLVARARHFERTLDWLWLGATAAALLAYAWMIAPSRRIAQTLGLRPVNAGIVLGLLVATVVWAVRLPFALVAAWWERRHGISRETYVGIVIGRWGLLLGTALITLVVLALTLSLAHRLGRRWWLAAAPALAAVVLALQFVDPYLASIGTHPLRRADLRTAVRVLERRVGIGRYDIRVDDVGRRTRAANAFAVGIGPSARVVLWSTLLDGRFAPRQIRFVIGHELAHLARRHVLRGVAWFALLILPVVALIAFAVDVRGPVGVPIALLLLALAQLALLPLRNAISRRFETEADWVALNATRDPIADRGVFTAFVATSLQDPSPPRWVHVLLDDHPTALQRVELARAWELRAAAIRRR